MALDDIAQVTVLKLDPSNPYANGEQIVFTDTTGILKREPVKPTPKEGDEYHTVKKLDNLYGIAFERYEGKVPIPSRWWHVIADANDIFNPLDISAFIGDEIIIPDIINFRLNQ